MLNNLWPNPDIPDCFCPLPVCILGCECKCFWNQMIRDCELFCVSPVKLSSLHQCLSTSSGVHLYLSPSGRPACQPEPEPALQSPGRQSTSKMSPSDYCAYLHTGNKYIQISKYIHTFNTWNNKKELLTFVFMQNDDVFFTFFFTPLLYKARICI